MLQKTITILQQNKVIPHVNLTSTSFFVAQKRPKTQFQFNKIEKLKLQASNSLSTASLDKINQQLSQANIPAKLVQKKGVGQKTRNYTALKKVFAEQEAVLQHQPGQVLLVDVWATWCGPCQRPMQHNQDMLNNNDEKWKGKVRIVAVSVDQQKDTIKERVNSKGWNKIQHLTLLGWDGQHPLIKDFQIQGIPFVYLVNKSGIIAYAGHPSNTDLQKTINQLIQKEEQNKQKIQKQSQAPQKIKLDLGDAQKLLNQQVLKQKFGNCGLFSTRTKIQVSIKKGIVTQNISAQVSTYQDTPQIITDFKHYFDIKGVQFKQNLVKFVNVPKVQIINCAECKKQLKYPFYWCKWQQNQNTFRCRQCIQKEPIQKQNYYNYLKNSIFIPAEWQRIAVKGLGKNIQPQKITDIQDPNQFGCNGCGTCPEDIGIARYICLACRSDPNYRGDYVDFCQQCHEKYLNKDQQKIKTMDVQGHNNTHPLLRILFNVNGYYDF